MANNPRRRRIRREPDISGQYRVTVPDAEELDQLRTRGGSYRRGLYPIFNQGGRVPPRPRSLPGSSRESSTEPMDTDEARQISEEIHRRIFREERERRGSEGDQPRSTEPLTRETRLPGREMGGDPSAGRETGTGTEVSLLNIPPPSMADEPVPEHPSLNRPALSDVTVDIERRGGARPRDEPVYTTRTIGEEMREAIAEGRAAQLAGTDFFLPLAGQPRISQMKSWRGPVITEQGNPGIYVQIDEWLPLYNGNVYVVDEVTGRMYLSKKTHLVRIPEMASHRPMQDHELSISRHIPERETAITPRMGDGLKLQYPQISATGEPEQMGGESTVRGEVSRTPQSREVLAPRAPQQTPSREGAEEEETAIPRQLTPERDRAPPRSAEARGGEQGGPSYSLPPPTTHLTPPRPPRSARSQDSPRQRATSVYPDEITPEQAERVRKRKLAALAVQQIARIREERDRMEERLIQEFRERRQSLDLTREEVRLLREELIVRYQDQVDSAHQPYMDLFLNLTIETEREMDFDDEGMADLTSYEEGYEWTEERYLRLRFKAIRHVASHGYYNDVYAYLLRTRPDELENNVRIFNENQDQWRDRTERINDLQASVEIILERQAQVPRRGYSVPPPADVLIPPTRPTMDSEMRPPEREGERPSTVVPTEPPRGWQKGTSREGSKASSLSPDEDVQKEDRDAAIEAVRRITGTPKSTPNRREIPANHPMDITGTPRYDWDTRYDGVQGFATQLRNRVSDPPTPQRQLSPRQPGVGGVLSPKGGRQAPRGGVSPRQDLSQRRERLPVVPTAKQASGTMGVTQPEQTRPSLSTPRQLLIYDETPTGRPLPTLRDIRQANLRRVLEEEGVDTPCDICGAPDHDYRTCPGGGYLESQDPAQSQQVLKFPYCGWCQQYGHISADCLAKHYDESMNARFPPKRRKPPKPLRQYDCRRCGQRHPFNVYCPFVTQPPVIPGECKSCGAVTNLHDDDCQYVEVKDEIGICSFCGQLDHTYAQCPEREEQREIAQKEREKNKFNKDKGKAKVKIVSGILTRQRERDEVTPSVTLDPPLINPSIELACSFCGNNTHGHMKCPVLHQYIRQQANELAAARASGYYPAPELPFTQKGGQPTQNHQPRDDTRTPREASQKGEKLSVSGQNNKPRDGKETSSKGWREQFGLPSGGGSGPPPGGGGGGPPDDGGGDDSESREEEGDETDEDTLSITDSSTPGDPGKGNGAEGPPGGGGPPEDPDSFPGGGNRTSQKRTSWT